MYSKTVSSIPTCDDQILISPTSLKKPMINSAMLAHNLLLLLQVFLFDLILWESAKFSLPWFYLFIYLFISTVNCEECYSTPLSFRVRTEFNSYTNCTVTVKPSEVVPWNAQMLKYVDQSTQQRGLISTHCHLLCNCQHC